MRTALFCMVLLFAPATSTAQNAEHGSVCVSPTDRTCPLACARDLSELSILWQFEKLRPGSSSLWVGPPYINPPLARFIFVNADYTSQQYVNGLTFEQAMHHARCHEAMFVASGNYKFHK